MSLEEGLKPITDGHCAVSYSSNRYMEFNALGVDKGQGLIDLANKLGIAIEETIAVGDNYNDMAMLKVAGLSVAANNAVDDVKAACDYTTNANNNEGVVAELIEKFILMRFKDIVEIEFQQDYYKQLHQFVENEYLHKTIFPQKKIF